MKLQSYSIVFALIVIPILLVLTYYIQLQVDTVTLQTEYDTKLLDATYDAMSSFEINTANEDLSGVSDALRSIIEASNNVFFNTLSTILGMSFACKSYVEPYVPAILYALYDGYYIYAPTKIPEILTNTHGNNQGVALTVGDYDASDPISDNHYKIDVFNYNGMNYYKLITGNSIGDFGLKYTDSIGLDYGQILYTAKAEDGTVLKDGADTLYTTDPKKALLKTKNVLKTYMPYSARYKDNVDNNYDIVITYTLDNYITIEGTLKNLTNTNTTTYFTKSGYLINDEKLEITPNINNYSDSRIQTDIENGKEITIKIDGQDEIVKTGGYKKSDIEKDLTFLNNQIEELQIKNDLEEIKNIAKSLNVRYHEGLDEDNPIKNELVLYCNNKINENQYLLGQISAAVYYCKAKLFTDWVINNFGATGRYKILEKNLVNVSGLELEFENNEAAQNSDLISKNGIFNFSNSDRVIFDLNGSNQTKDKKIGSTEIDEDSPFYTHKLNVIRNSMQYNLNLAMTTYAENSTIDYAMPIISDSQWEDILSNPTIVAFMQGLNCGLKTYNNYVIVSSTNNEISVSPKNIYYVKKDFFNDENSEYHKINCPHLNTQILKNGDTMDTDDGKKEIISFTSKEIKYDKIYNKAKSADHYWYDHKNLACYYCINDGNYSEVDGGLFARTDDDSQYKYPSLVKAYYIALAKERNNLYKPNAVSVSQGFEVIYDDQVTDYSYLSDANHTSDKDLNDIDYVEVVFKKILVNDLNISTVALSLNTPIGIFNTDTLNSNDTRNQTRLIYINNDIGETTQKISANYLKSIILFNNGDITPIGNDYIRYIKVFYK